MRRPTLNDIDDYSEKGNVTIKSMLISMVRVCILIVGFFVCYKCILVNKKMPPRLWKLMICQVIGWIAYFATHLYFTDFVARVKIKCFL